MPIQYIGGSSANSTTTSLPSGALAGDLLVCVAGRTNTGGPSLPAGWPTDGANGASLGVVAGGSGGSSHGQLAAWKYLTADDIAAGNVGTWGSAAQVGCLVYRGAGPVGANSATGASGTTVTFPARSGLAATSWQVALGTHRSSGANSLATRTLAGGYTNRSSGFSSADVGLWDSATETTGISQQTATVSTSSGNVGRALELTESQSVPEGSGAGTLAIAGTGAGSTARSGSGSASLALGGVGTGSAPVPTQGFVAALPPFRFAGLATPSAAAGFGTGQLIVGGTGAGSAARSGSGSASLELGGVGTGSAPAPGVAAGFGVGVLVVSAAGSGSTSRSGSGSGTVVVSAAGSGSTGRSGSGSGTVVVSAAGSGSTSRRGTGTGPLELGGVGFGRKSAGRRRRIICGG
jgi:hypothetical protein